MKTTKKGPRIASSPKKFDPYITTSDDRLQATEPTSSNPYWQFLGLSSTNASDWHNKRLFWDTSGTGLFSLYSNPATSTTPVKAKVKQFIKDFRSFANPLLSIIAASPNASADEENIFNLVLNVNRQHPSQTHTKIANQCVTGWKLGNAGTVKAASRSLSDSKCASVANGADGVQYAYLIMDENPSTVAARTAAVMNSNAAARTSTTAATAPIPVPLPVPVPQNPDDGAKQEFYSGATHQFNFGADKEGKYLCVWSRWFNSKHPELAGDWNEMQIVRI